MLANLFDFWNFCCLLTCFSYWHLKKSAKTDPCMWRWSAAPTFTTFVMSVWHVRRVTICFKTFVFKISQKRSNMAGFVAEVLPDIDNYPIIINYKFWSSLMSYANINQWKLYTNICSFIISREKSEKNYKIGLVHYTGVCLFLLRL